MAVTTSEVPQPARFEKKKNKPFLRDCRAPNARRAEGSRGR
jgi:hypothetical protein